MAAPTNPPRPSGVNHPSSASPTASAPATAASRPIQPQCCASPRVHAPSTPTAPAVASSAAASPDRFSRPASAPSTPQTAAAASSTPATAPGANSRRANQPHEQRPPDQPGPGGDPPRGGPPAPGAYVEVLGRLVRHVVHHGRGRHVLHPYEPQHGTVGDPGVREGGVVFEYGSVAGHQVAQHRLRGDPVVQHPYDVGQQPPDGFP